MISEDLNDYIKLTGIKEDMGNTRGKEWEYWVNAMTSLLSDEIFEKILHSKSPKLEDAQDILNNIATRKLPKLVGEARLTEENKLRVGLFDMLV